MTIFRFRISRFAIGLLGSALCAAGCAFAQAPEVNPPQNPRLSQFIDAVSHVEQYRDVNLSPDGKLIVWTEFGHDGFGIRLASLADPSSPRTITACAEGSRGMESEPVFSPDGRQIAFLSSCTADKKPAIFLADAAGGAPHQLAELNGYAHDLAWSPDGKQLSFLYVEGSMRQPSPVAPEPLPSGVIGVEGVDDPARCRGGCLQRSAHGVHARELVRV